MPPRKSDHGGEVTSSSVGANVRVLWKEEELERLHFASLQVPWSFVGKLRDEAEKNEHNGIMTVDLAVLRNDGVPVFTDDFGAMFREVFVRRFVPCLHEKFNQRDPSKPLSRLPEDVSDALKLLVLCERLKAAIKQDVKDHLDRLVGKTNPNLRPNEGAPFKIVQASLELDTPIPPRGTLQERVVHRATEMLASMLPDSLDALQELVQLACELGRHEMATRLFRATAEKALSLSGVRVPLKGMPATAGASASSGAAPRGGATDPDGENDDSLLREAANFANGGAGNNNVSEAKKLELERQRLTDLIETNQRIKLEIQQERVKLEQVRGGGLASNNNSLNESSGAMGGGGGEDGGAKENGLSAATCGTLALRQGLILDKVGQSAGERVVRLSGDVLEWRKGNGRFTKEHTIMRQDVVSVKVVDPQGKTFLLSTRTGLLTLRTLSDGTTNMLVSAIEQWVKGMARTVKKTPATPAAVGGLPPSKAAPAPPMMQQQPTTFAGRLGQRLSMSFKRSSFRGSTTTTDLAPAAKNIEYSFNNNNDSYYQDNDLE